MRLRTQVLLLQLAVIAVSLAVGFGLVIAGADGRVRDEYGQRALAIAQSVAATPEVRDEVAARSVDLGDNLAAGPLPELASATRVRTGALFVVIGTTHGIRLTHPDPAQIGHPVSTDPARVLAGHDEVTTDRGTLGDSVRAKVPIRDAAGHVIGFVSVGVSTRRLASETWRDVLATTMIAVLALGIGVAGSAFLARRWRRLTLGLQPDELADLVHEQRAVLHSMADGVLAVDPKGTLRLVNDKARQLLSIDAPVGTPVSELGLGDRIRTVLDEPSHDPVAATVGDRIVLVASRRVEADGHDLGMVMSVIDRTDVERLTREMDTIRSMSDALRDHRHETANRMHVLAGLLRHGNHDEALDYLEEITGTGSGRARLDGIENVREPHLHAFVDAKAGYAREFGVTLRLGEQSWVSGSLSDPVLVTTILGNLIDNAVDSAAGTSAAVVEVDIITDGDTLVLSVADSGPGIAFDDPDRVFAEGTTTKDGTGIPGGRGMGLPLARQHARQVGGDIWVGDPGGATTAQANPATDPSGAVFVARLPGVLLAAATAEDDHAR